ncbi:hypothetical protein HRG_010760 [Hirsutella rhossiliensis]|uniref:Uncharacterized protein n=1 Tax=Hirsutella rhossiliensis TaxID=111463 RepID=A0A9P8MN06_9HYPO|nr:uncharacterized protein HRG_10760 [Hirsutella rhossiliensis]KAH0958065.1 hypothetical protein HRG_10760 [Hirsutella rhossiliensis]
MNWTEGSLARHSKAKPFDDGVARQKRHFARARAQRRHDSGPPPALQTAAAAAPDASRFVPDYLAGELQGQLALAPSADDGDASASLKERRARLLDKSDWAGIEDQPQPSQQQQQQQPSQQRQQPLAAAQE